MAAPAPQVKPVANKAVSVEEGLRKVRKEVFKNEGQVSSETAAALVPDTSAAQPSDKNTTPPAATTSEPKKETAPVENKDPFDHISPPDGMSEKSITGWKALKKEAADKVATLSKQHADALAQLETYKKATPADTEKAARLEAQLKDAHDKLAVLDLQNHPDFARQYVEPKRKALAEAKTLLDANLIENTPDFTALMTKPLKEFSTTVSELAAKMPAYDQGAFVASMREAYRLQGEERGALTKSGELKQQLDAKSATIARQAFEESRVEFTSKVPEIQVPEGASEEKVKEISAYNAARSEALKEAEHYSFGKISEKDVARISQQAAALKVVAGHLIPSLQRERDQAVALNKQLIAEIEAIKKGKSPGQFTDGNATPVVEQQNRNAKSPNFAAIGRQVGLR